LSIYGEDLHFLKDDKCVKVVANTLHFWDNKRIELISYCIISNHVHAVFRANFFDIAIKKANNIFL